LVPALPSKVGQIPDLLQILNSIARSHYANG